MAQQTEHTAGHHPTFMQYALIAMILFTITIVEFLLIWDRAGIQDDLGAAKIPLLIGLSAVKFAIVIMFYMHLKFDNRLFGTVFISGLTLAFIVGLSVLGLFVGYGGGQRSYAASHAVPYDKEAEEGHAKPASGSGETKETETPATPGPVAIAIGAVGETLAFNTDTITAISGAEVTITFTNPSANNQHNLVIVQDGTKDAVAADGTTAGPANDWVPPGDSRVIANTSLLSPGATGEVTFTAPAPGTYQFVCTFPAHNFTMFGNFVVN